MILFISGNEYGQRIDEVSVPTIVGQMKRWVTKQIGRSIWQKSYFDRVIRNDREYGRIWRYIHLNPVDLDYADDNIDFFIEK